MEYIGIDISKDSFVAAFPAGKSYTIKTYSNDPKGINKFIKQLDPSKHHCAMEATGSYTYMLLYMLETASVRTSLINPRQTRNYARTMMAVTKTDQQDACLIADFAKRFEPAPYKLPEQDIMMLKQKKTVIRQLKKQLYATRNLQESIAPLPFKDAKCQSILKKTIDFLEKQIKTMETELVDMASISYEKQLKLLTSIKGIGMAVATALLVTTGGFAHFDNAKQLSRYVGFCPTIQQSGSSLNIKGHINRNGDEALRAALYVASWSASRYNRTCKEMFDRMRSNGKPSKVALVAVANKLLRQAYAVVKSGVPYDDNFTSTHPNCGK